MQPAKNEEPGVGYTVSFTRHLAAPRETVFELWTDPAHLARWWGPAGFTNPVCEFEARAGGRIHIDMRAPDGTVYPMDGRVEEIRPPERLVLRCTCCADDTGVPGIESLTTVTFESEPGGTHLVVESRVTKAEGFARDALAGMEQGWSESLERLAEALER
jgi:uncharacterized protein YndB with AHSA1/START domain